jgi:flagellar L-ring protein precursor FlgH
MRARTPLLLAAAAWLLSGCYTLYPKVEMADTSPVVVPVPEVPAQANGSIYQAASYRPLFEDPRARMVGDSLTVQIVERLSASQSNSSSVDKSGSVEASVLALPGIRPGALRRATAEGSSTNSSSGKGSTETSNDFTGTITVVVREVLPNGHLVIAGEKQIGVNANVDVLRFTGQVDPRYIRPGNVVQSASIANVRLEQRGRGAQADAQAVGWLSRVFLSVMPI